MADFYVYNPTGIVPNMITAYHKSVHTPTMDGNINTLKNPVIPNNCPVKYMKKSGSKIIQMTAGNKAVIDQRDADAVSAAETLAKDINNVSDILKAGFLVLAKEAGMTPAQYKQAVINEINTY